MGEIFKITSPHYFIEVRIVYKFTKNEAADSFVVRIFVPFFVIRWNNVIDNFISNFLFGQKNNPYFLKKEMLFHNNHLSTNRRLMVYTYHAGINAICKITCINFDGMFACRQ